MEVADMKQRKFVTPTKEEITERKNMYARAEELGIDLMCFDDEKEEEQKRDLRKAVVYLGMGKEVPEELKERILMQRGLQELMQ